MNYIEELEEQLKRMKQHKKIVDYHIDGNDVYVDVYVSPFVPINYINIKFEISSDGDAMVSTG
jgi:hypothetical protein